MDPVPFPPLQTGQGSSIYSVPRALAGSSASAGTDLGIGYMLVRVTGRLLVFLFHLPCPRHAGVQWRRVLIASIRWGCLAAFFSRDSSNHLLPRFTKTGWIVSSRIEAELQVRLLQQSKPRARSGSAWVAVPDTARVPPGTERRPSISHAPTQTELPG